MWTGKNDTKTISVDGNRFENGANFAVRDFEVLNLNISSCFSTVTVVGFWIGKLRPNFSATFIYKWLSTSQKSK